MSTIYTYSLSGDFTNGLNSTQLHSEIVDSSIVPVLNYVNTIANDVDIEFVSALSGSDQTTLSGLITAHTQITNEPGSTFDAICDASGNGDYLLPSAAFAAGHKTVFMRNGTYIETVDIVVPNYGSLVGESGPNTVIYFPSITKSIVVDGSGTTRETAGTVSITADTKIVTGVGTTFTNLSIGDYILIGPKYFKIATIESATSMTLADVYRGSTISAFNYIAQTMFTGTRLSNFIITGSTSNGLFVRGCRHFTAENLLFRGNTLNILIEYSGDSSMKQILSETSGGAGVKIETCSSIALNVVDVYNNITHGIEITGNSLSINLISCEASNNGGTGICIMGACTDINLTDCILKYNNANGIFTNTTSHSLMVDSTTIRGNTNAGLVISGNEHTINGNIIEDNGGYGIEMLAADCVVSCNIFENNTTSIKIVGNSCITNANHVIGNSLNGIYVSGDDSIVTSNISTTNTQAGIEIETGATDNIVSLNNCKGNTGTNIIDNGTTTTLVNNKS